MKLNFKFFVVGIIFGTIGMTTVLASEEIKSAFFSENKFIFEGKENGYYNFDSVMLSVIKQGETTPTDYGKVSNIMEILGFVTEYDEKNDIITLEKNGFYEPKYALNPPKTKPYNTPIMEEEKIPVYQFPEAPKIPTENAVKYPDYVGPEKISESKVKYFWEDDLKSKLVNTSWLVKDFQYVLTFYEDGRFVNYFRERDMSQSVYVGTYTIEGSTAKVVYDAGYYIDDNRNVIAFRECPKNGWYTVGQIKDTDKTCITMGTYDKIFYEFEQIPVIEYYKQS